MAGTRGQSAVMSRVTGEGTRTTGRWGESSAAALEVKDFQAAVKYLKKKKIPLAMSPEGNPMCWMLGVRDPDGNLIVLHKRKRRPRDARIFLSREQERAT